jgi:CoA-transferase family III
MARPGVATAARALVALAEQLDRPVPRVARVGADLWVRSGSGDAWPDPAPLLRAADGWVHPGPTTAWASFVDMVMAMGAPPPAPGATFPDLTSLPADVVDAEAAAWMLPAAAVRTEPAPADPVPAVARTDLEGATVVVLGTAWATPLVGHVLADLGARAVKVEDPRRPDPFPLHDLLVHGQERRALDLGVASDRDQVGTLLEGADLLVDGHPPRVRANAGLGDDALRASSPTLAVLRVAAFVHGDRPGYGPAAEARGGWAARHDPPRLGRSSVADPVAGLLGALAAVALLTSGAPGGRARVSLEGAVGHLLAWERADG